MEDWAKNGNGNITYGPSRTLTRMSRCLLLPTWGKSWFDDGISFFIDSHCHIWWWNRTNDTSVEFLGMFSSLLLFYHDHRNRKYPEKCGILNVLVVLHSNRTLRKAIPNISGIANKSTTKSCTREVIFWFINRKVPNDILQNWSWCTNSCFPSLFQT